MNPASGTKIRESVTRENSNGNLLTSCQKRRGEFVNWRRNIPIFCTLKQGALLFKGTELAVKLTGFGECRIERFRVSMLGEGIYPTSCCSTKNE